MNQKIRGKKLLILGANAETTPLVRMANEMGIKTIVTSHILNDDAKKYAWKFYDINGLDVPAVVSMAREENIDGVLVGVADVLVPAYCKVCNALELPCYATQEIVDVFSYKDMFKAICERHGIHGVPEYYLDEKMRREDLQKIVYPVIVKPVDSRSGIGITVCYKEDEVESAINEALAHSRKKRFLVEKYMQCDDMGMYYTFKDGVCSASCIYDRYTTDEQKGVSRVCLGGTYPSKYIEEYYERMHDNAVRMFKAIGIKNGVLMLSAFYENGEFYVYDTGFRLQGEAPHILMNAVNGFDQREMLIRFALTGNGGDIDLENDDDSYFRGKWAATLWFLLKSGKIEKIYGLNNIENDNRVISIMQRFHEHDEVQKDWVGTEKQVFARLHIVCDTKQILSDTLKEYMQKVEVLDPDGNSLILKGFDVDKALELEN